ncbi:lipocalin family protein [Sinomicrobium soli]|uniref:lipocalin family protein n=1 Tax=Sinomicrobium sp. N-1-3-6 TaxID=2219864 RepID=UPI000DCF0E50|nr:lipocalin family protein [Sinomicrobium sp. N-1-3-6]RAV30451.1 hypothetical protein DN748_02800 [Sinomicrobium sp. N-1-3-6]
MKRANTIMIFLVCLSIVPTGCTPPPGEQLHHLNGYWEIEKVEFPDGAVREYDINTTIDYMEITADSTGFRKKMQPRIDGGYYTSDDREDFSVTRENDRLFLRYHTPLSTWKEEVISITEDRLILRNADNLNYLYKRYEPLDLESLREE